MSIGLAQNMTVDWLIYNVKIQYEDFKRINVMHTNKRHHEITKEMIAKKWGISTERAKLTLDATTQMCIRSAVLPLSRRYRTDLLSTRLRRSRTEFFTDTLFSKVTSLLGNNCAQIFTDGEFIYIHPMKGHTEIAESLQFFCEDVGVPAILTMDNAPEQTGKYTDFKKYLSKQRVMVRTTEPYSPWQNRAERQIGKLKGKWMQSMVKRQVPKRFWDFGLVWESELICRTASTDGQTPIEKITGETPDISKWVDFEFYQIVRYWDQANKEGKIGRWLGVSHRVGSRLAYWVINEKGNIFSQTTMQHLTDTEILNQVTQEEISAYEDFLSIVVQEEEYTTDLDGFDRLLNPDVLDVEDEGEHDEDINENRYDIPDVDDMVNHDHATQAELDYDRYVGVEVPIQSSDGTSKMARVTKRMKDDQGKPIGTANANPSHDTTMYKITYVDGDTAEVEANIIAKNMFNQIDSEDYHYQILKEIQDHYSDGSAIQRAEGFITSRSGNKIPKKTTRGWELLVEFKDGSYKWIKLKDLKQSNPVELAEYAIANGIQEEPAFKWWVKQVLKKREQIIMKVKSKYWRTTHKFGIQIPKTVDEAREIDRTTKTDHWERAIQKEMRNCRVAFEKLDDISVEEMRIGKVKPGYKEIRCHMIFDIKMDGKFTRKARFVAGGHMTYPPASITFSSVVSRDSV